MTMASQDVPWQEISCLASLLRENGDKVLSGNSKLRLTPALLMKLNAAFSGVNIIGHSNDFQVTSAHASQSPFISQLHFLHDFVQKTLGLTVVGCSFYRQGKNIDLSRFRSLRHLELRSCIPAYCDPNEVFRDFSMLRTELETLVLMHIMADGDLIGSIFTNGSVFNEPDVVWSRLSQLVVSYCGLRFLSSALSLANNLQWLDASHNMLTECDKIGSCLGILPKLRYLNLSFNRLKGVPVPLNISSISEPVQLQILLLSHNYIDNLNGIDTLTSLVELNLAANQLQDHTKLSPLNCLYQIQHLKLAGNPIAFHKHHRRLTASFISPRAVFPKHRCQRDAAKLSPFLLDGARLSDAEMEAVRVKPNDSSSHSMHGGSNTLLASSSTGGGISFPQATEKTSRRNRKIRHVVIGDLDDNRTQPSHAANNSSGSLESSGEHLRTKQDLESVRRKFEDNWLRAKARPAVQELLGVPLPTSAAQGSHNSVANCLSSSHPLCTSTPLVSPSKAVIPYTSQLDVEDMENLVLDIQPPSTSDSTRSVNQRTADINNILSADSSQSPGYITANDTDSVLHVTADTFSASESATDTSQEVDTSEATFVAEEEEYFISEDDDDSEVGENSKFLVQEVDSGSHILGDLFLVISPRYIKEVNSSTGQKRQRWLIDSLQSSIMISVNPCFIQLSFDTVVHSKKERVYQVELKEAQQQLLPMLQKILEARSLSAMNFAAFQCMKCSGQFSADLKSRKGPKCPTCGSVLVFELDEAPVPSSSLEIPLKPPVQDNKETTCEETCEPNLPLIHSPSCSSIGSAASLESPGNTVNLISTLTASLRRCESDIDIISNPSQSSIEVLDDVNRTSYTPGRKRSSEERQVVAVPSLRPVPECSSTLASLPAGLTESSSSGSLTDSVCTAYENSSNVTLGGASYKMPYGLANTAVEEERSRENSPHNEVKSEDKNLHLQPKALYNMLDGLLQTMSSKITEKEGTERRTRRTVASSEELIQYNYVDFSSVDHRLKLYLCLSVLDADEREVIQLLLRAEVVSCLGVRYPGILIITSQRVCVIKITGPEDGDSVDRWFSRVIAVPRKSIQSISALPWGTGISVSLQGSTCSQLMFILRDEQYLNNFFSFLNRLPQETTWVIETLPQENFSSKINQLFIKLAEESFASSLSPSVNLAVLLCSSCVEQNKDKQFNEGGLLVVASNGLLLFDDSLAWLFPNENAKSNSIIKCIAKQLISNLIEVKLYGLELKLLFLDESAQKEEVWNLILQSESVFRKIVDAIRCPWEELFSVPMQVTFL